MAKQKRVYLLPHNDNYSIIDSYHTGGIEGEGFIPCDNCHALISRVAIIQSSETNTKYSVGFDCAKTLTSIKEANLNSHLEMFKLGESIRRSFLNYFKQTAVCKVTLDPIDDRVVFVMSTDNEFRTGFNKTFVANDIYHKYIHPQIKDLTGFFIKRKPVSSDTFNEFINHMKVDMEINVHSYHQKIISIDKGKILLQNLYIKDKYSTSVRDTLSVLGDLIYTEYFKELMLKYNLL